MVDFDCVAFVTVECFGWLSNVFLDILQQVRQLEILCTRLYEATDAVQRAEAEKTLVQFQNAPDTLNKCQLLLQRGDSPYSQLLAATTLTKLVTRNSQSISLQQRVDMSKCFQHLCPDCLRGYWSMSR